MTAIPFARDTLPPSIPYSVCTLNRRKAFRLNHLSSKGNLARITGNRGGRLSFFYRNKCSEIPDDAWGGGRERSLAISLISCSISTLGHLSWRATEINHCIRPFTEGTLSMRIGFQKQKKIDKESNECFD